MIHSGHSGEGSAPSFTITTSRCSLLKVELCWFAGLRISQSDRQEMELWRLKVPERRAGVRQVRLTEARYRPEVNDQPEHEEKV